MDSVWKKKLITEWTSTRSIAPSGLYDFNTVDKIYNIVYNWEYYDEKLETIIADTVTHSYILEKGNEIFSLNKKPTTDQARRVQRCITPKSRNLLVAYSLLLLRHLSEFSVSYDMDQYIKQESEKYAEIIKKHRLPEVRSRYVNYNNYARSNYSGYPNFNDIPDVDDFSVFDKYDRGDVA